MVQEVSLGKYPVRAMLILGIEVVILIHHIKNLSIFLHTRARCSRFHGRLVVSQQMKGVWDY
jgi:hypothetical protein